MQSSETLRKDSADLISKTGKSMGFLSLVDAPKPETAPNHTVGFLSFVDKSKMPIQAQKPRSPQSARKQKKSKEKEKEKQLGLHRSGSGEASSVLGRGEMRNFSFKDKPFLTCFHYTTKHIASYDYSELVDGILFMFSANDIESYQEIKKLLPLYRSSKDLNEVPALIVATKIDHPSVIISKEEMKQLSKNYDIPFTCTSSKDDIDIQETFEDIYKQSQYQNISIPQWKLTKEEMKDKLSLAVLNNNTSKIKSYLEGKQKIPQFGKKSWTAMHVACWEGNIEAVFLFIQYDPNTVHLITEDRWTPLHCAARGGHLKVVELLVTSGADVMVKDHDQSMASSTNHYSIRNFLEKYILSRKITSTIRSMSHIERVADEVGQGTILNMNFSKLCKFPDLSQHTHLREICFISNLLKDIPDLSIVPNLEILILIDNQIEFIPESISNLKKLECLDLRKNRLSTLNTSIGEMKSLKQLFLGHNLLSFLPSQLGALESTLEMIDLYGNPLASLPSDIIPSLGDLNPVSNRRLFAYLNSMSSGGETEYNRVKIMFVGDGNVGKTSLINCFLATDRRRKRKQTSVDSTDTIATDGIDIHEVIVPLSESKDMTWDCWDYAGQEIYYTTHQFFLSPRSVYLVCYNLLDRNLSKIEYWINSIHARARGSPIFLIGTHWDDKDITPEYQEEFTNNLITTIKPERFKNLGIKSIRGIYCVGSKKRVGIKELMDGITNEIIRCKFVGKLYPITWIKAEKTLSVMAQSKSKPYITMDEFKRIATGCQVDDNSILDVLRFLHATGVLCYFENASKSLEDIIILDPQFLTKVMSSVITIRHRFGQDQSSEGVLLPQDLPHIWRDYPSEMRVSLMKLLEQFEVAFLIESNSTYVIPSLLPLEQPNLNNYWNVISNKKTDGHVFGRYYTFEFLPLGFFPRLFVRNYHLPEFQVTAQWRNGQVLRNDNVTALFRYNPTSYTLKLEVHGKDSSDDNQNEYEKTVKALRVLIENIETTIEGWYETNITVKVPCSHCLQSASYDNWEFSLESCMESITNSTGYVLCRDVRKIRMDYLAPDLSFSDLQKKLISFSDLQFEKTIGEGAFGKVSKGKLYGEDVAIKELNLKNNNNDTNSDESSSMEYKCSTVNENSSGTYNSGNDNNKEDLKNKFNEFQREVWIMSCLDHPCVCGLIGVCMNPMAIVMDYLALGDLYTLFDKIELSGKKDKVTSFEFVLLTAYDIAKGMSHLHSFSPPIIHRDLRSPNIFVLTLDINEPVRVKVGDFGLSRLVVPSLAGGDLNLNWLAPEVMKGDEYDIKIDVYSFGIILWELCTLQKPFEEYDHKYSGKPGILFKSAVIEGLRPTVPRNYNEDYIKLMKDCWEGNPSSRPTFDDIVERLEEILKNNKIQFKFEDKQKSESIKSNWSVKPSKNSISTRLKRESNEIEQYVLFTKRLKPVHTHTVQVLLHIEGYFQVWAATGNGEIVIWHSETLNRLRVIVTDKNGIYSLQRFGDIICVGCANGSILGYTIKDHKKQFELKEHTSPVRTIISLERKIITKKGKPATMTIIFSGDGDGNLCMWIPKKKTKLQLKQKIKVSSYIGSLCVHYGFICVGTESSIFLLDSVSI